jgi:hypothetical protein
MRPTPRPTTMSLACHSNASEARARARSSEDCSVAPTPSMTVAAPLSAGMPTLPRASGGFDARAEQPARPVHLGCSPWQAATACGEGGGRSQAAAEARSGHWEGAARCFGLHKCAVVVIGPTVQRCTHGQSAWQSLVSAGSARAHEPAPSCSWLSVLIYEPAGARLGRGALDRGNDPCG